MAALVVAAACGGDDGGGSVPEPDAGHPDISGLYLSPMDFDRVGCEPGSLSGLDPASSGGVWHHDFLNPDLGAFPGLIRYGRDAADGLTAWLNLGVTSGREAMVTLDADDLFVRVVYTTDQGLQRVRAVDVCRVNADGTVDGKWALCNQEWDGTCYVGELHGVRVQRLPGEGESSGVSLLSSWSGAPEAPWPVGGLSISANVRVRAGVAYVARYGDGLRIVNVSDPSVPADLGFAPVMYPEQNEIYNDVKVVEAAGKVYALMASSRRGIVVLDVTDPTSPVDKGSFPPIPDGEDHIGVHTLFTESSAATTRAYLANLYTGGLDVWDVTNPLAPVALGGYVHRDDQGAVIGFVHDLYVEDGRAYLCYWDAGLVIVDTKDDPSNPTLVGVFDGYPRRTTHSVWVTTTGGRKVALVGDEDWDAHLRIVDVDGASPQFLQQIGELSLRPEVSIHNIMAFGTMGYVSWYQDGLRLVDVSNPAKPQVSAYFNTWQGPGDGFYEGAIGLDVDLGAGLVYLVDEERGLFVLKPVTP